MKLFDKRNIVVGVFALVVGVSAAFGIANAFSSSTVNITGNVAAFILNPEGRVDGAVLETGDQVRFGAETGVIVTQQIKVGDQLSAAGSAGDRTQHGRELKAESLQIGGNTITVVRAKPIPPHAGPKHGPGEGPKGKKVLPPGVNPDTPAAPNVENRKSSVNGEIVAPPIAPLPAPRETMSANGSVLFVLVGKHGEPKGLILRDGTQLALPKEVQNANLTFNEQTSVSVEGEAAKSDFGTFIKPIQLTIGDQIFSFNR